MTCSCFIFYDPGHIKSRTEGRWSYADCRLRVAVALLTFVALSVGAALAGVAFPGPPGGWAYTYQGDAAAGVPDASLDGTWEHNNGSDEWDGIAPGGAVALVEGDVT